MADGQLYRLLSVMLVHGGIVHLLSNMYALYLVGPIVEGLYGSARFLLFYLLTAAAASTLSYVITPNDAVGASGAIFGLFGILFVAQRIHHPLMDRQARSIATQIGALIVINLVIGFGLAGGGVGIDNFAHVGGLLAGAWIGLTIPPRVPTLASSFTRPGEAPPATSPRSILLQVAAVLALVAVIGIGTVFGTAQRSPPSALARSTTAAMSGRRWLTRATRRGPASNLTSRLADSPPRDCVAATDSLRRTLRDRSRPDGPKRATITDLVSRS